MSKFYGSYMKWVGLLFGILLMSAVAHAQDHPVRPHIIGIAGVDLKSEDWRKSKAFYSKILESDVPCVWCGDPRLVLFYAFNDQYVLVSPHFLNDPAAALWKITFQTDSVPALRKFLKSYNVPVSDAPSQELSDDYLVTTDPEGHRIGFTDRKRTVAATTSGQPMMRIIHAGFVVKSRALEDTFYKDVLGFRVYWQGGMKDSDTDWVDMQVPDGTDWLEYMLNVSDTADRKELGVMNHIAIGVPDIESAAYRIQKNGLTPTEQPQIGRDGKWQLNLYDPDSTRVELMEFTPVQKPCCSGFTGQHPGARPAAKASSNP
jgi:catechol 2,3-dioxygenase-like lactoylglutathione lyase family enzyme